MSYTTRTKTNYSFSYTLSGITLLQVIILLHTLQLQIGYMAIASENMKLNEVCSNPKKKISSLKIIDMPYWWILPSMKQVHSIFPITFNHLASYYRTRDTKSFKLVVRLELNRKNLTSTKELDKYDTGHYLVVNL